MSFNNKDAKMSESKLKKEIMTNVEKLPRHRQKDLLKLIKLWLDSDVRTHERRSVSIPIKLVSDDEIIKSNTRDISCGGTFIDMEESNGYQAYQPVSLAFHLSNSNRSFKINGSVVRVEKRGIAIQFQDIPQYFSGYIDQESHQA